MAKSKKYIKIRMTSTGKKADGKSTGSFRVIKKNKTNHKEKMRRNYFDRYALHPETGKQGAHVEFVEGGSLK